METKELAMEEYFITDVCFTCGACEEVCPQGCIGKGEAVRVIDQEKCVRCGICYDTCPIGAIVKR